MINRSTKFVLLLHTFVRYLIFPILTSYGLQLKNSTPEMLGFIIAVFGLTAAIMTIPMVAIAKKFGVRASLTLGFIVFAIGAFMASVAETIQMMALARAVQGAGAVSGVLMLMCSTQPPQPKKIASYVKINLVAFVFAMALAKIFFFLLGGQNIFRFIATTATISLVFVLLGWVNSELGSFELKQLPSALGNTTLCFSYLGSLLSYAIFAGFFVIMPINILLISGIPGLFQPAPYIIAILIATLFFLIDLVLIKKLNMSKSLWVCAVLFVSVSMFILSQLQPGFAPVIIGLTLLFSAMMVAGVINVDYLVKNVLQEKIGAAKIINLIAQFVGIFVGAGMAGLIFANFGSSGVYIDLFVLSIIWLVITIKSPKKVTVAE